MYIYMIFTETARVVAREVCIYNTYRDKKELGGEPETPWVY